MSVCFVPSFSSVWIKTSSFVFYKILKLLHVWWVLTRDVYNVERPFVRGVKVISTWHWRLLISSKKHFFSGLHQAHTRGHREGVRHVRQGEFSSQTALQNSLWNREIFLSPLILWCGDPLFLGDLGTEDGFGAFNMISHSLRLDKHNLHPLPVSGRQRNHREWRAERLSEGSARAG